MDNTEKVPGDRIRDLIKLLGITTKVFADKIGSTPQILEKNIGGRKSDPSLKTLNKIGAAFPRVNLEWIVTGQGEPLRAFSSVGDTVLTGIGNSTGLTGDQIIMHGGEGRNNTSPGVNIADLQARLLVCEAEKNGLEKLLASKEEMIEILKNK